MAETHGSADQADDHEIGATRQVRADDASRPDASPLRGPRPRLYVFVDAIVRHGSIRRAGEELGIASSALNRRLLDFEAQLGTALFTRLRHGLRLTPAGEIVAAHIRATLEDGARVADRLRALDGEVSGRVAIASAESAAMAFLPSLMASMQTAFPALNFVLAVGPPQALLADLLAGRVDLIVTHEEPRHGDVALLAAVTQPFCAVMRVGHPLSEQASLSMEACVAFPIVIAEEDLAARALFDAAIEGVAPRRQPALVTNLFEAMKRYVAMTDAVSFQFSIGGRSGAVADGLVAVPLTDGPLVEARLFLATQRGRVLPPGAQAVARRIEAVMSGSAPG